MNGDFLVDIWSLGCIYEVVGENCCGGVNFVGFKVVLFFEVEFEFVKFSFVFVLFGD